MNQLEASLNGTKTSQDTDNKKPKEAKRQRHLPSLPSATSAAEMTPITFSALTDKTPVEWSSLENYEVFSLSADGSFPMVKVSRSKAVRLCDRKVMMAGSGRCHRVSLSNH
jgi:hypothetical protein